MTGTVRTNTSNWKSNSQVVFSTPETAGSQPTRRTAGSDPRRAW